MSSTDLCRKDRGQSGSTLRPRPTYMDDAKVVEVAAFGLEGAVAEGSFTQLCSGCFTKAPALR